MRHPEGVVLYDSVAVNRPGRAGSLPVRLIDGGPMNRLAVAFFPLFLSGCATTYEPVSTGPGTYMVAAEGVLGNSSTGAQAVKAQGQAADFCAKHGKQVHTINASEVPGGFGKVASATVNFRCVDR